MYRLTVLCVVACALSAPKVYAEPLTAFSAVTATATAISLQKRATGTYYVPAAIAGYGGVELLVDTGSSYLVINETILARLKVDGAAKFSHNLEGSMADGSSRVIPVYRLAGIKLGDSCWIPDVDAAVFPQSSRPILGMNVLARLAPFTFSADPPALQLHQCQEPTGELALGGPGAQPATPRQGAAISAAP